VKQEGDVHLKGHKATFTIPLYVAIPKLGNGGPMSKKFFAKKYDLSCVGLGPKHVKVPKDITLEESTSFLILLLTRTSIIMSSQRTLFLLRRWKGCGWWCIKRLVCQH